MQPSPYSDKTISLSTTDILAIGRNKLANERTWLAYVRTFLSFVVAGVSLIQFFNAKAFVWLGYALIPAAFLILIVGAIRFCKVKKRLNNLTNYAD